MRVLLFVLHMCMLRGCEAARLTAMLVWGGGAVVLVSAGHVGGTRCSCIVSSAADVLVMSVMRGMTGVGRVYEVWMCLIRPRRRGLGLGFTDPVVTGGLLDVCLCLGCGGVGGEVIQGSVGMGWCYVCVSCESG